MSGFPYPIQQEKDSKNFQKSQIRDFDPGDRGRDEMQSDNREMSESQLGPSPLPGLGSWDGGIKVFASQVRNGRGF